MSSFDDDTGVRWMLAYQSGDESAFDRIVESYSAQIYALLTRFLGPRTNREDLVQEVFLRVIRARERYRADARFSTWLFRIVFNIAVNETQRGGRTTTRDPAEDRDADAGSSDAFEDVIASTPSPSSELERADVVRAVRDAIARLPETQRMALILAKYEELPYVEIGRVLGASEQAVKSLVHRVNNLLAVVFAQAAAARVAAGVEAKEKALVLIEQAALTLNDEVRRFRAGGEGAKPRK